jgi:dihydroorotase
VDLIREAKAKGLQVTCSVAVSNLVLTDEKLDGFDTRFKLSPPLRTNEDRMALLAGVADNTIDIITSDHNPIDIEHKKMEFDGAKNGSIGLESAFGALLTVLPVETIVAKLTYAKSIFSIESSEIAEGKPANVTLFSNDGEWIFTKDAILSKSKNSAFLGTKMKGKVIGIYNKNTFIES